MQVVCCGLSWWWKSCLGLCCRRGKIDMMTVNDNWLCVGRRRLCACAARAYKTSRSSNRDVTCCLFRRRKWRFLWPTTVAVSAAESAWHRSVLSAPSLAMPGVQWITEAPLTRPWTTMISCRRRWRGRSRRRGSRRTPHHRRRILSRLDVGPPSLVEFAVSPHR